MNTITGALKTVMAEHTYQWIALFTFAVFFFLYLITLPASYTGGYSSIEALKYLNFTLIGFSVLMAALVGFLMPLSRLLFRTCATIICFDSSRRGLSDQ